MSLAARFASVLAGFRPVKAEAGLGLAVSGGSDSTALMHLAADWAQGRALRVATIDHGLRPESGEEALSVARAARALGLPHRVLPWQGWDGRGNLQEAARCARRKLLADWARAEGLGAVLLGHTQDDQAETVLMRLARGSGVDGLAGMAAQSEAHGVLWLRPLLGFTRAELRGWLRARGLHWVEDPSNDDPGFDRIKARQMLAHLDALGLTRARLARTAAHMQDARAVLETAADQAAAQIMRREHGDIVFEAPVFDALPAETRHRLAARALCEIAGSTYRPRLKALQAALDAPVTSLHGCLLTRNAQELRITREANAVAGQSAPVGALWDRRWTILPPAGHPTEGLHVAALGAGGLAHCLDRSAWHLPRRSLEASPAVWAKTRLIAAPLAGFAPEWQALHHLSVPVAEPDSAFGLNTRP